MQCVPCRFRDGKKEGEGNPSSSVLSGVLWNDSFRGRDKASQPLNDQISEYKWGIWGRSGDLTCPHVSLLRLLYSLCMNDERNNSDYEMPFTARVRSPSVVKDLWVKVRILTVWRERPIMLGFWLKMNECGAKVWWFYAGIKLVIWYISVFSH